MTKIETFYKRLDKLGIKLDMVNNFPWIYLYKINGKSVKEKFHSEHGFVIALYSRISNWTDTVFTDEKETFKLIRKYISV